MRAYLRTLCVACAVVLFAILASPTALKAQLCGAVTYVNNTPFDVVICLVNAPCIGVPAGATIPQPFGGPLTISGVYGASGAAYPWKPNPLAPPPLWVPGVWLAPNPQCYDILFDPATCTVTINLSTSPFPCPNP